MQINVMRYEKSDFRGSGRTQRQEVRRTGDDPRTDSLQEDTRSRPGARFNGSTSIRHTVIREVAGVSLKDEKTMIMYFRMLSEEDKALILQKMGEMW